MNRVKFVVEIEETKAKALAQFVKRVGYSECRANAVSEEEAYQMIYSLEAIREGLATVGFNPR